MDPQKLREFLLDMAKQIEQIAVDLQAALSNAERCGCTTLAISRDGISGEAIFRCNKGRETKVNVTELSMAIPNRELVLREIVDRVVADHQIDRTEAEISVRSLMGGM